MSRDRLTLRDQLEKSVAETATILQFRKLPEATADPVGIPEPRDFDREARLHVEGGEDE